MDNETIENIKRVYKQKTGLKRVSIKPKVLKGTGIISDVFVLVNGKRKIIADRENAILI